MGRDRAGRKAPSTGRRRWTRTAAWALVVIGVVVSWAWSVELTIDGESVRASVSGAATFLLLGAGITLIWLASPRRGRRMAVAYTIAVMTSAAAAIAAGVAPIAVIATTTGTVTATIDSGMSGDGYSVSDVAIVTSDGYRQTDLRVTVHADDRATPWLAATVSFADGGQDLACSNTRQTWTHEVSTVTLSCDDFVPISSLSAITGIALAER